ncbi:MAG: STAS domain-containing protein [Candidatus Sumerlaeaceae bacterium]
MGRMMTEEKMAAERAQAQDSVCFAELPDGLVVVKIYGRGTFSNSVELKRLGDYMFERGVKPHFIIDLDACTTMDSTFMGVLASVALREKRELADNLVVVNANPQNYRLLHTLGLAHFMDVRTSNESAPDVENARFHTAETEEVPRLDQIIHMIEAHQSLCDVDSENEVRFKSVLQCLSDSLKRETEQDH